MTSESGAIVMVSDASRTDEQRLAALIGQDMAGVLELSLDARILRANDHFCRITGFSREALLGKHLSECVLSEDWPSSRASLDALLEAELPRATETRFHCLNGGLAWLNLSARLIRAEDGGPAGFICLLVDISASMQLRERLILAEERLRLALDGARMGVWFWDLVTGRLECSHVALAYLGLPPGAQPGFSDFLSQVHPEDRPRVEAAFREALDKLEPLDLEFRVLLPDGTTRWLVAMARGSRDASGLHGGMQGLVGDVSHRKAAEALLEQALDENLAHIRQVEILNTRLAQRAIEADTAVRAREALLRNVGHEFRTPLNHMCGALDLVLLDDLPQSQRRWLVIARDAATSLSHTVDQVMDVARLAAGQVAVQMQDFSPAAALREVTRLLMPRMQQRELQVATDVADDVPAQVSGDGAHIVQTLLIFFDNAIKFTPSGTITLSVRRLSEESDRLWLRFEVRDTGIGIAPEIATKLFAPFVQGDDSTTRPYGGLGIGLSNAREFATLMGGKAGVSSEAGQGSTFWLDVPVRAATLDPQLMLLPEAAKRGGGLSHTAPVSGASALLKHYLVELRKLLLSDDLDARASLLAAPPALLALAGSKDFEHLQSAIERYDFPEALLTLDLIEGRFAAA